ncbi:MAG: AI-2E family transporter [Streptococcaceae bacterium]|jgi:predicted PurR-regulated permease PerM|nr:AI-2E family transporter [Streptococcaceae bacterium]
MTTEKKSNELQEKKESKPAQESNEKSFSLTWFFRWFIDNKGITFLLGLLLLLLNFFLLYKVNFIFKPILSFLGIVLLPIVLAALFYYLLNPIVDFAEKHKVPRTATIAVLFALLAGLLVWALAVAIPAVTDAAESFIKHFPTYLRAAEKQGREFIKDYNLSNFNIDVDAIVKKIGDSALNFVQGFYSTAVTGVGGFISKATGIVVDIIIFPFILFYLLRDGRGLAPAFTKLLPTAWRKDIFTLLTRINAQLSSFIRGEVIVALAVMVMFGVGLKVINLPYALVIAIVAGIFNLIPYLGSFLAFALALVVGIMVSPWMLLKVVIVFVIEQTIEGRFIQPLVIGSQMKIHPITILFILLTAGSFFGVWGVFLGIPVYATLKVIITHVYHWYRLRSPLFPDEESEEEPINDI